MTARYQVPVSNDLLGKRPWRRVEGLSLVSVDGPWVPPGWGGPAVDSGQSLCTFEDLGAPPELGGKLVTLILHDGGGRVTVAGREVIG